MTAALLALLTAAGAPAAAPSVIRMNVDGDVPLGQWIRAPMGLISRQFDARPREKYRVEVRWSDPQGLYTFELSSGTLPFDKDLDEATDVVHAPKIGPVSGATSQKVSLSPKGNGVWFRINPTGDPAQMLEYRVLRLSR